MAIDIKKYEISIPIQGFSLKAFLNIPEEAKGLVIFSHGSGSSRFSPRNNYVAGILNEHRFATLLADLLTPEEDQDYETRFNILLLTRRLLSVTKHIINDKRLKDLPVGYFGASTGAASALHASIQLDPVIKAIVSRGGRPDLARNAVKLVKAPILLIVGSLDTQVMDLNTMVFDMMHCKKEMVVIQNASHLFEEPGKLKEVADLAVDWFEKYLTIENKVQVENIYIH